MSMCINGKFCTFGEIVKTGQDLPFDLSLEWRIQDFSSHIMSLRSAVIKSCCMSPVFKFCDSRCYFSLWPCYTNERQNEASEWVILRLNRVEKVTPHLGRNPDDELPPQTFNFSVGIKGSNGVEMIQETQKELGFHVLHEWQDFCLTSELIEQGSRLMPDNVLTITCDIKRVVPSPARVHMPTVQDEVPSRSVDIAHVHSIHELRAAVESLTIEHSREQLG